MREAYSLLLLLQLMSSRSLALLMSSSFKSVSFTRSEAALSDTSALSDRRRRLFGSTLSLLVGTSLISRPAHASETVGKEPNCNESSCLGVWDGLLADCPHELVFKGGAGCASSQDDTPGVFAEPWDYSDAPNNNLDWEEQMRLLTSVIQLVSSRRGDKADVVTQIGRYLRVLFTDGKTGEKSVGEFYFTLDDTTVQFRVGSTSEISGLLMSSLKNIDRCEMIRKELRYLKVPVLRNRTRSLFFVESDFDVFGPGSASLGPPAEMLAGELEGRQSVDSQLKIDLLQSFPRP